MKKTLITVMLLLLTANLTFSADLLHFYNEGKIKLVPESEFARGNNWNSLFENYFEVKYGNKIGTYKSLAVSDDGDIFIGNYDLYNIYKFDKNGKFIKEFGNKGTKSDEFIYRPTLRGILDNQYVVTSQHNGHIMLFDFDGNFKKVVKVDYMPLSCVPLKNGKIAIAAHVPYGNGKVRYIVSIKDIYTGAEKIVESKFSNPLESAIVMETDKCVLSVTLPFSKELTILRSFKNGNLIVADTKSESINIYTPEGSLIKSFKHNITPIKITSKEIEEYKTTTCQSLKNEDFSDEALSVLDKPGFFPEHLPYFYDMIIDSDDNILLMPYSSDSNSHIVRIYSYSPMGKFVCETELDSSGYDIRFNPRFNDFLFHDNFIYGILAENNTEGIPLRLLKMKVAN